MRTTSRRRFHMTRMLAAGIGAAALMLVAPTADATSSPAPTSHRTLGAPGTTTPKAAVTVADPALAADGSLRMPRTAHDEAVGDYLGLGYDQRAVVENGRLNIYNPPSKGGGVVRSTLTDLAPVGPSLSDGHGGLLPVWQAGPISDLATANRLASVYLVWTPDGLYMAGSKNVGQNETYQAVVYKVAKDGTCASSACAIWTQKVRGYYTHYPPFTERTEGVTALAVGTVGAKTWVAVGYSMTSTSNGATYPFFSDGVGVISDPPSAGGFVANYLGFGATEPTQVAVTGLAWDPSGSGWLAVGTTSPTHAINAVKFLGGTRNGYWGAATYWDSTSGDDYSPSALSAAVTNRADGTPVMAFGMSDGTVKLWDPAVTSASLLANIATTGTTTDPDPVDALTFVDRIDGTSSLQDLVAVSSKGNKARVLRYTGATTFVPQAVAPKAVTVTDVGGIRLWFPGYKTGALRIVNGTNTESITLTFASRPNAAYGCWFGPAFPGRSAFPSAPVTLRGTSGDYTIGGLTAGAGGDCAATDTTGQWAAYVIVAPTARPSDRTTAKLNLSRDGKLILKQVGGSLALKAVARTTTDQSKALGSWDLTVAPPPLPTPPSVPTLSATQLDPAGTDRPVYRLDLAATTWSLPYSTPARISSVIPAMVVRGSNDNGSSWTDLGRLIPQGQPTRATSGSVTLAPATFYWQNPASGPAYDILRVTMGPAYATNPVRLPFATLPTDGTHVGQLVVCPAIGNGTCSGTAQPFANGLDQTPLKIQILDDNQQVLPTTDPDYGRIYYRDDSGDLLTGLIPMDGSAYVRVSPYPGAYSNDGSAGTIVRPSPSAPVGGRYSYVSTTSTLFQEITAHVGGSSESSDFIDISGQRLTPSVPSGSQASVGFYTTGCADFSGTSYCRLRAPASDKPTLYITTDLVSAAPAIGLLLQSVAQNAFTSLPLQQLPGQPEHTVAASTFSINSGEVTLDNASSFQPGDSVDAYLVTHGSIFQARGVKVGGGN